MVRQEGAPVVEKIIVSEEEFLSTVHEVHRGRVARILTGLKQIEIEGRPLSEVRADMQQVYDESMQRTVVWDAMEIEKALRRWAKETSPSAEDELKVFYFKEHWITWDDFLGF